MFVVLGFFCIGIECWAQNFEPSCIWVDIVHSFLGWRVEAGSLSRFAGRKFVLGVGVGLLVSEHAGVAEVSILATLNALLVAALASPTRKSPEQPQPKLENPEPVKNPKLGSPQYRSFSNHEYYSLWFRSQWHHGSGSYITARKPYREPRPRITEGDKPNGILQLPRYFVNLESHVRPLTATPKPEAMHSGALSPFCAPINRPPR